MPLCTEGAGAGLEVFLERPAKCGRCLVAGGQRDLRHRITAEYQPAGRPFEANAAHVVARCLAQIGGEDAVKVKRREAGHGGQGLDGQGRVQVLLDVEEYGVEPLTMEEDRLLTRLHCLWGHHAARIAESERANYPILALSACGVFTLYEFVFVLMGRYRLRPIQRRNFDANHNSYTLCR